jgi:hypothetical protein
MAVKTITKPNESDAPTRQINPAVGNRNQEMIDRRNLIADQADEERDEDLEDVDDARPPREEEDEEEEETPERSEDDPEEESEEGAPEEEAAPAARKYKIKVNGRELELTEAEMIERAQKVESADDYLRLSSEAFRKSLTAPPSAPAPADPEAEADTVTEEELALARALQMGDEQEAAKAIRRLRAAPSLNRDELTQTIDERMSFQRAFTKFESEYSDVVNDPNLWRLAQQRDQELLRNGDTRAPYERFKAVGDELRSWKKSLAAPDTRSNKEARKASVSNVPGAASRQSPRQEPETEENTSSVIAKMAASRQGRPIKR